MVLADWIDVRPIEDPALLDIDDGCYARLRMFDPTWQQRHGFGRIVCLDLDSVVMGPLAPLFSRPEPFVILGGAHHNPCPYNGSVMMLDAGHAAEVWRSFAVERAQDVAYADGTWRGSDQTWLAWAAPGAPTWSFRDGVYAFGKPGWPKHTNEAPGDARIITFPGWRDPERFKHLRWVEQNWR